MPLLVNCMPSGKYLMEDFCYAGGMPVVLKELHGRASAQGRPCSAGTSRPIRGAECYNPT